ncbi:hypothetical protein CLOM_g14891 [Closterium sp. NIES-68]|nr:hypothetical protein CLOM_g14891 [Closterium sp. NIES-68]GJP75549.1 hypothetical protein CLOP_g5982 [Closterium sp. NIES-67]
MALPRGLSFASALALIVLLAASLAPAAHARNGALVSDEEISSALLAASAAARSGADGGVPGATAGGVAEIAESIQRQGPRILNVETYEVDEPLPDYLSHVEPHRRELQTSWKLDSKCDGSNLILASKFVSVFHRANYLFNFTMVNTCKFSLVSPLVLFNCFDFGNVLVGSLENPARNPTQYQTFPIFGPCCKYTYGRGNCAVNFNNGPKGNIQIRGGQTASFLYAWNFPLRACNKELTYANGDRYFMDDSRVGKECEPAPFFFN